MAHCSLNKIWWFLKTINGLESALQTSGQTLNTWLPKRSCPCLAADLLKMQVCSVTGGVVTVHDLISLAKNHV